MAELTPLSQDCLIWGVGPPWEFIHDPEIEHLLAGIAVEKQKFLGMTKENIVEEVEGYLAGSDRSRLLYYRDVEMDEVIGNIKYKKKGPVHDSSDEDRDGRYFDLRLKDADVPRWDGDPDKLLRWIQHCNLIAEDGRKAWRQLGKVVPRAFTGTAQDWYFTLPALADFFLSSKWLDKTRTKALCGSYRQADYSREKPSEYFIRKQELLNSVYSFEDSSVMSEVMNGAPRSWCIVLDTQTYDSIVEFHAAIIFHEDTLMDLPMNKLENHERDDDAKQYEPFQKPDTGVVF
ncbi:hypothetical protein K438DRAFT_1963019 [Mycena galopus ATCC 62051]|nr:hypothetical protein K438DRAFT_1963019 [Mycena galopus ATCC 62051]